MNRRRFLGLNAGALLALAAHPANAATWRGTALGADVAITVRRSAGASDGLAAARRALRDAEATFDLHRPSALAALNARTHLTHVPQALADALALADRLWHLTGGAFDPTVQPLWHALAFGGDIAAGEAAVGWERVTPRGDVRLAPGQALTLNGIAQGIATDAVYAALAAAGTTEALVEVGEFRALGGPWRVGIDDPQHGMLAQRTLHGGAVATSSPGALTLAAGRTGGVPHTIDPRRGAATRALWSTVSVEATSAALADGLSTAFCLMERSAIADVAATVAEVKRVTLVDHAGDLTTL